MSQTIIMRRINVNVKLLSSAVSTLGENHFGRAHFLKIIFHILRIHGYYSQDVSIIYKIYKNFPWLLLFKVYNKLFCYHGIRLDMGMFRAKHFYPKYESFESSESFLSNE